MATKQVATSWEGVLAAAKAAGVRFPELVAAQWALESGWGKHTSGKHNYFGLKGSGTAQSTTEYVDGKPVTVKAEFLDFASFDACLQHLVALWYEDWEGYKGVNRAANRDAAARELVKQGYATDPAYAEKLIKLMNEKAPGVAEPVKASSGKAQAKPVLFRIEAVQDTWLKKRLAQSAELGEKEKVAVPRGKGYAVCAYSELAADGHARVELGGGAGTWFVFEAHWRKVQGGGEAMPASVDWADFNCLITPNLSVGEVLQWDKRRIPGPGSAVQTRLLRTAAEFQRIREAWGRPLGVTSFYRPEPINQQVGGVPGSKHVSGEAFDVYPVDRSLESFYQWIRGRWTGGLGDGQRKGFVHLDVAGGGRFVPGGGVRPSREWDY
jgi:hypothetical protein